MADHARHKLPVPQSQAFVVCREIWENARTGEFMLASPLSHIPVPRFPAEIRLSVYAHVTGGHGSYPLEFILRDPAGESVWSWRPAVSLDHRDPLAPHQMAFHDLMVRIPAPGRYDFVLLAGGEEIGGQPLLIGSAELLRE